VVGEHSKLQMVDIIGGKKMADLRLLRDNFWELFIGLTSLCLVSGLVPFAFYIMRLIK